MLAVIKDRLKHLAVLTADPRVNVDTTYKTGGESGGDGKVAFSCCILSIIML